MPNDALQEFLGTFGDATYPHRDELLPVLKSGCYQSFLSQWPNPFDCARYALIYSIRADHTLADFSIQCRAVAEELCTTPELPCRLFLCDIDGDRKIAVFTRPDAPKR